VVRVSAGTWTSRFLAQNIAALTGPGDGFRLRFLPAEERLDIGRRAAEIGLRNRRPEEAWLAGQRLGRVAFAIYGPAGAPAPQGFVAPTEALTPSSRWLRSEPGALIAVEVGNPWLVLDLVRAGAGRAVLPCFVGDAEPGLARLDGPLPGVEGESWLVMHHEERHDPAVRTVARRIVRLLRAERARFEGSAPEAEAPGN
jgi:DNA-binding transcriptional LysR family regulator